MEATLQAIIAAAASFLIISLIFSIIFIICKKISSPNRHHHHHQSRGIETQSRTRHDISSTAESASYDPSLHQISMTELSSATRNFSATSIIGDGSFGIVYKATLSNGVTVAVKKLSPDAFQGFREFRAEMDTLGQLRHPNIVKILGYCASGADRVLIYEFIEEGSLDQWLHDASSFSGSIRRPLSWESRMKVVKSAANGLAFLHGLTKPIIHRDIKASNVLLDSEFEAHISDFGLARRIEASNYTHVSTQVAGTMGYMPPEYREGFMGATVKADVYSFGVLMLEIATGRRPNLPVLVEKREIGLVEWARKMLAENKVIEMVDSVLYKEKINEVEVSEFFKIASKCTRDYARDRPLMSEVVVMLNQLSHEVVVVVPSYNDSTETMNNQMYKS